MTVYEVHGDNGETHEDHCHWVEAIFISKELAQAYCDKLNNQPKEYEYDSTHYKVVEHKVLTELPL